MTYSDVMTLVRQRTRTVGDSTWKSPTDAWLRNLIGYMQRFYNCGAASVVESASFTTTANTVVHDMPSAAIALISVYDSADRPLKRGNWTELRATDANWYRRIGSKFDIFALIGSKLFALYPALPIASTVTLYYTKLTDLPTLDTDALSVPDVEVPFLVDLCELVILLRSRELVEIAPKAESLSQRLQILRNIR